MSKETENLSFEEALQKLEAIVEEMEKAELPLDKLLQHLEKGMELTRYCRKLLAAAELKVETLLQNSTEATLDDFDI